MDSKTSFSVSASDPDQVEDSFIFAGFWLRTLALQVDFCLIFIISSLTALFFGKLIPTAFFSAHSMAINLIILFFCAWAYYSVSETSNLQGSIGKKMLRLRVVNLAGSNIGFKRSSFRFIFRSASIFIVCIPFLPAAFSNKKQSFHDWVTRTLVIRSANYFNTPINSGRILRKVIVSINSYFSQIGAVLSVFLFSLILKLVGMLFIPYFDASYALAVMSKSYTNIAPAKNYVQSVWEKTGKFPGDIKAMMPQHNSFPDETTLKYTEASGTIEIIFPKIKYLEKKSLILSPVIFGGVVKWDCRADTIDPIFIPIMCKKVIN
jgi:uncharacterized RDD family membrane protein YckC